MYNEGQNRGKKSIAANLVLEIVRKVGKKSEYVLQKSVSENLSPVTAVWKWGISKRGILKSPVSHVLNFLRWD